MKKFKWISLIAALLIIGCGVVLSFILWGIDPYNESIPSKDDEFEATHPTEYAPKLFSKIIKNEIEQLGFAENITFTCQDDNCFYVEGIFKDLNNILAKYNLSSEEKSIVSTYSNKFFFVEGHLGINDKGNATLILDRIISADRIIPADIATEFIETKTNLTKLVDAPFEEISLSKKGVEFKGKLPPFIRIALYKLPPLSESE